MNQLTKPSSLAPEPEWRKYYFGQMSAYFQHAADQVISLCEEMQRTPSLRDSFHHDADALRMLPYSPDAMPGQVKTYAQAMRSLTQSTRDLGFRNATDKSHQSEAFQDASNHLLQDLNASIAYLFSVARDEPDEDISKHFYLGILEAELALSAAAAMREIGNYPTLDSSRALPQEVARIHSDLHTFQQIPEQIDNAQLKLDELSSKFFSPALTPEDEQDDEPSINFKLIDHVQVLCALCRALPYPVTMSESRYVNNELLYCLSLTEDGHQQLKDQLDQLLASDDFGSNVDDRDIQNLTEIKASMGAIAQTIKQMYRTIPQEPQSHLQM